MKELTTKRKFYNKWLYKITLSAKNCWYLRSRNPDFISKRGKDKTLIDIAFYLDSIEKNKYFTRIEGNYIDVYTNDPDMIGYIREAFKEQIKHVSTPSPDLINDHGNPKSVISKKLPHDRYRYKVFLLPHKIQDVSTKIRYLGWLDTQVPRVMISETVKQWFIKTVWKWDRRYMYVEDEQTLLMLKMKNPEVIGSVYSYTVSDK